MRVRTVAVTGSPNLLCCILRYFSDFAFSLQYLSISISLMCIKKVKLINHDCLPILMLLYIMLYIVLAYLMLFAALTNAVCLNNASSFFFFFFFH